MRKFKRKNGVTALKQALLVASSLTLLMPAISFAEEKDSEERITITGSRIQRSEVEGANPVTILTRDDFNLSSANNIGEFIQSLPSQSGGPQSTKTNNGGNGSVGVDIRGMGAARTLMLVNGRRVVDGGDLQTIPMTMVERIEILKDGASAIYGADAVAGVLNIITRKDFEGAELTAETSSYQDVDGGGKKTKIGLISGINSEKGNITWGIQWDETEGIVQGDTKYDMYLYPLFVLDDSLFTSYRFPSVDDSAVVPFGSSRTPQGVFNLAGGGPALTLIDGAAGTSPADFRQAALSLAPGNDLWNYAPVVYIQTPFERLNFFTSGHYQFNENANLYMEFRGNHRTSDTLLAPVPYDTNIFPGYVINPATGALGVSADNHYNPFGEDIVRVRRRMIETGGRQFTTEVNQYQATVGVDGYVGSSDWNYDISMTSGERTRVDTDFGQFSGAALANALGPSFEDSEGNIVCGTAANPIAGCVSLNVFGGEGTISQEMLDYAAISLVDRFDTSMFTWNATVTGEAFELPAGPVGVSFGLEYRDDTVSNTPDSSKQLGAVTGGTGLPSAGRYKTDTLFFETVVPLLSDAPGARSLELSIGGRKDDNSLFGDQTTFQTGIRWQPYSGMLIRATYSDVFRAPTIGSLFGGQSTGATPTVSDPCSLQVWANQSAATQANCLSQGVPDGGWNQTDTQLRQTGGGNPDLNAEEGNTQTVGIAWSPDFVDGLNLTLDWWKIELDGGIQSISAQNSMNLCAQFLQFCDNITRDVSGVLGAPGAITNIDAFVQNVATEVAEGIDLDASYHFDTEIGHFRTMFIYSHILERTQTPFEGGTPLELEGTFNAGLDAGFAQDKFRLSTDWTIGQLKTSLAMDYISGMDTLFTYVPNGYSTDDVYYLDAQSTYTMPETDTKVTFGISNLLDEDPVYIDSAFNSSTDEVTYRTLGRQFMLRISHSF